MRTRALTLAALSVALAALAVRCASTDAIDSFACAPDGSCPSGLVCSPDRLCAPAEICGDLSYVDGGLQRGSPNPPQDTDLDGRLGCEDPQCTGRTCASGVACMTGETCLADGGCGGGTFCNAPPECHHAQDATCEQEACVYPADDAGTRCDEGYCGSGGTCLRFDQPFGYVPRNFAIADVVDAALADVTIACDSTFDTAQLTAGGCLASANIAPRVLPDGDAGELVVIAFRGLTLVPDASVTITGDRPLVLAVFGDARINGAVVAGAHGASAGPGARDCGLSVADAGGGGSGAGFGTAGGAGGLPGPDGGDPIGPEGAEPLVGGCSGGSAGADSTVIPGGGGGGAFQLSASGVVQVHGVIAAPGGGGLQGLTDAGGSGGGSGGTITVEGDSIVLDSAAALTANGGSGGTGRPSSGLDTPYDGADGHLADAQPAVTTSPGSSAGEGGPGAAGAQAAGSGGVSSCLFQPCGTSGGGGGGLGRIHVNAPNGCTRGAATVLSPDVPACAPP